MFLHVPWVRPPLPSSWRPIPGSSKVSWNSHDAETVLFWPHAVWRIAGHGPPRRWMGPASPTRIKQRYGRILSVAAVCLTGLNLLHSGKKNEQNSKKMKLVNHELS